MTEYRKQRIAGLVLATDCLWEDIENLRRLSAELPDDSHKAQCAEIARNISAQVEVVRHEIIELQKEDKEENAAHKLRSSAA